MVERLTHAVAKARAQRARATAVTTPRSSDALGDAATAWAALKEITLDSGHLERKRIVTYECVDPAHAVFDMLRARILNAFAKHGWTRVGITSPTKSCGKTFVAGNLALCLARQKECRTVLMDLDLRAPGLAKVMGTRDFKPMNWFLSGEVTAANYLRRVGANLALGLGEGSIPSPAETLLAPETAVALDRMCEAFEPDVVIYDLPPMLACDDVLCVLPHLDCVLLVIGGEVTRPTEVAECERLLEDQTHLLGVLLNKGEDATMERYGY